MNSHLSRKNKIGLAVATLLAIFDLLFTGTSLDVLVTAALMGVVTIVGVIILWARGSRTALRAVAASRILSGMAGIPVFFTDSAGPGLVVTAAVFVVLTVLAVGLMMARQSVAIAPQMP